MEKDKFKYRCPVITFDPGTRHLGVCRVDSFYNDDLEDHGDDLFNPSFSKTDIKIVYWNTIDLLEGTPDKDKIEKQVSITDLIKYLIQKLDKILPELLSGDTSIHLVEIEKQFATTRMCNVSMAIYSYFMSLKSNGSRYAPIKNVQFQAPNHKYKLFYLLPGITKQNIIDNNKQCIEYLKNLSKNKVIALEKMNSLMNMYDPYGDELTLNDMGEIISINKSKVKPKVRNWSGQSHQDTDDNYRKTIAYDFNKKISVEMTLLFLYYFNIDPLMIDWFKKLKKKDDPAEAFNINIFVHIREKKIVNARTQYIIRTVKKVRRSKKRKNEFHLDKIINNKDSVNDEKNQSHEYSENSENTIISKFKKQKFSLDEKELDFPENIDDLFIDDYSVIHGKTLK